MDYKKNMDKTVIYSHLVDTISGRKKGASFIEEILNY